MPLIVRQPGQTGGQRITTPVSLVDLLPTLMDWSGGGVHWPEMIDGRSWLPLLQGHAQDRHVISEYTDMGVIAPARMIRQGPYKYIHTHGHPPQLYDLQADPMELSNLAGRPQMATTESALALALLAGWDGDAVHADVLASQRRRLYLKEATRLTEPRPSWDYQATRDDSRRFVRAHGAAGAKALARFPFVPPPQ